jgi:hypothetical protein
MKGPVNFPAASWPDTRRLMRIHRRVVTPECFNRGSSPNIPPGFPLKACGNDGLEKVDSLNAANCGNRPRLNEKIILHETSANSAFLVGEH